MPLLRGMRMSISTTSGSDSRRLGNRLGAVARLADHLDVRLFLEDHLQARGGTARDHRRSAPESARRAVGAPRLPGSALTVPPALVPSHGCAGASRPRYLSVAGSEQPRHQSVADMHPATRTHRSCCDQTLAEPVTTRKRHSGACAISRHCRDGACRDRGVSGARSHGSALHEADDPVVVAAPPVDDARHDRTRNRGTGRSRGRPVPSRTAPGQSSSARPGGTSPARRAGRRPPSRWERLDRLRSRLSAAAIQASATASAAARAADPFEVRGPCLPQGGERRGVGRHEPDRGVIAVTGIAPVVRLAAGATPVWRARGQGPHNGRRPRPQPGSPGPRCLIVSSTRSRRPA